jgi:FKBP-type peptidyl-prolyl cis-trans isomerase FklB
MNLRFIPPLTMLFMAAQVSAEPSQALAEPVDQLSYSFGYSIGNNLKKQDIDVNSEHLIKGLQDAFSATKPLLSPAKMDEVMKAFQKQRFQKQVALRKASARKNLNEGEAFLTENAKKPGVVVLESGLQYKIIKAGEGEKPKADDKVTTNYRGRLIDGTEFDSSYKRGKPATFPVNGVIAGWREALQLMKEGAKWKLFIPAKLAYGERGTGNIGPNAILIFDIELLSIVKE